VASWTLPEEVGIHSQQYKKNGQATRFAPSMIRTGGVFT
jgi:hypothetical protein